MTYNKRDRRVPQRKQVQTQEEQPAFSISFEQPQDAPKEQPDVVQQSSMEDHLPQYGSPEWQKYVLGLLNADEVNSEGYPKCFGLRRVANLLLGPIVSQGVSNLSVIPIVTAEDRNSRAVTVVYDIHIEWNLSKKVPVILATARDGYQSELLHNDIRKFSGTADCVEDINSPYGRHPAASAETKAESRALKKALLLNILTAEEKVSGYDERDAVETRKDISESKISEQLKNFILAKLAKLNLDVNKTIADYLSSVGSTQKSLNDFTMSEGQQCFTYINSLQQDR